VNELRQAIRTLGRAPAFTLTAVLTIALGIAASTAVFSVVYAVLYRPLPYPDADRLVAVWQTRPANPQSNFEHEAFLADHAFISDSLLRSWQENAHCFEDIGGYSWQRFSVLAGGEVERVEGIVASSSFLKVLGVRPLYGRLMRPEDDRQDDVAVLGHAFWKQQFAGDPNVVGRTIVVDGSPHAVIGVLPANFHMAVQFGGSSPALLTPLAHQYTPQAPFAIMPGAVARLRRNVSVGAAQAEMTAVMLHLAETRPSLRGRGVSVVPLSGQAVETAPGTRQGLLILLAATGCILLIACVNVTNLLLVRATTRQRDLGVRMALGAGRLKIIGQGVSESLLLALGGGALGLLTAAWATSLLVALVPKDMFPRIDEVRLDWHVLAFGTAASAVAGLLAGSARVWYILSQDRRGTLADALRDGYRSGRGGRGARVSQRALVVAEVALAMVLLVGSALLARTYFGLVSTDLGIRPAGVLTFHVTLGPSKYPNDQSRASFVDEVLTRLRHVAGVQSAGAGTSLPLGSWMSESTTVRVGGTAGGARDLRVAVNPVTDGFFETAGIALESGRLFEAADQRRRDAAIVNRSFVRAVWPNASSHGTEAIGHAIRLGERVYTIVGVVGDVKYEGPAGHSHELVYVPFAASTTEFVSFLVHSGSDTVGLIADARGAVQATDADMAIDSPSSLEQIMATLVAPPRFRFAAISAFGLVALALAFVGLYGVIAQSVAARTQEIGVRLALGAGRQRIIGMVLREGLALAVVGVALGVGASLALARACSAAFLSASNRPMALLTRPSR
jgi:predicted permease